MRVYWVMGIFAAIVVVLGIGLTRNPPEVPSPLEEELAKVDDITVHVLPYPVVRAQSVRQVKAIWCSKDRAKTWEDFVLRRIEPPAVPPCNDPIDKIVAFGVRHGVDATPTWFLENGERYSGVKRAGELSRLLDHASPARR